MVGALEIAAIMGPSGTGKTVLLKHLIGLMKPDRGRVLIDGFYDDVTPLTDMRRVHAG